MRNKTGNGHNIDLEQFMEDIKTVVQDGQQLLKATAGTARQKAVAGAKSTDKLVHNYPYHTLGIVLGVGVVAGLLLAGVFSGGSEDDSY
jgi:ElaB/YqjD/DUF883 family membrane-anchored ribosome-binding protein